MGLKIFDGFVLGLCFVVPVFIVWRFRVRGVILGTLFIWIVLFLDGVLLNYIDENRNMNIRDSIWLLFGWFYGLLYCSGVYVVKVILEKFKGGS